MKYVLTSINTLYCAGKVAQEFPQYANEVAEIMGEDIIIHPKALSALKIEADGEFTDLCDNEMNEINTELIDEVSDQTSRKYMDLYWLQEKGKNEIDGQEEG